MKNSSDTTGSVKNFLGSFLFIIKEIKKKWKWCQILEFSSFKCSGVDSLIKLIIVHKSKKAMLISYLAFEHFDCKKLYILIHWASDCFSLNPPLGQISLKITMFLAHMLYHPHAICLKGCLPSTCLPGNGKFEPPRASPPQWSNSMRHIDTGHQGVRFKGFKNLHSHHLAIEVASQQLLLVLLYPTVGEALVLHCSMIKFNTFSESNFTWHILIRRYPSFW